MPCQRCLETLESAASTLDELLTLEPWALDDTTYWKSVRDRLVALAGTLRRGNTDARTGF